MVSAAVTSILSFPQIIAYNHVVTEFLDLFFIFPFVGNLDYLFYRHRFVARLGFKNDPNSLTDGLKREKL